MLLSLWYSTKDSSSGTDCEKGTSTRRDEELLEKREEEKHETAHENIPTDKSTGMQAARFRTTKMISRPEGSFCKVERWQSVRASWEETRKVKSHQVRVLSSLRKVPDPRADQDHVVGTCISRRA